LLWGKKGALLGPTGMYIQPQLLSHVTLPEVLHGTSPPRTVIDPNKKKGSKGNPENEGQIGN
jgi:hypothetical protein